MAKVSVGLRGWRFDEEEIFTDDGDWVPIDDLPDDTRNRLLRLANLVEKPCDACYLIHGEAEKGRCNPAAIVYGEPSDEVLLCDSHEADFLYWFREAGGADLAGEEEFRDSFHEWFASGERAPEGYGPDDHVETDPESLPELPTPKEAQERVEEAYGHEKVRYDLRQAVEDASDGDEDPLTDEDLEDIDLGTDYPTG